MNFFHRTYKYNDSWSGEHRENIFNFRNLNKDTAGIALGCLAHTSASYSEKRVKDTLRIVEECGNKYKKQETILFLQLYHYPEDREINLNFIKKYKNDEWVMNMIIPKIIWESIYSFDEKYSEANYLLLKKIVESGCNIKSYILEMALGEIEEKYNGGLGHYIYDPETSLRNAKKLFYFIISNKIEKKYDYKNREVINTLFPIDKIEKLWRRHKIRKMARQMLPIWYHPNYIGGLKAKKEISNFFKEAFNKDKDGVLSLDD